MLRYKQVAVERLVCTCDRCGLEMEQDGPDPIEWQERFFISFWAGFGSVFGDGNHVAGDFCQSCVSTLLGKWLRVTEDDPFEPKFKPETEAEKVMQLYQFHKHLAGKQMVDEISALSRGNAERAEKREQLARQLGVAEDQVLNIALNYLMEAVAAQADAEHKSAEGADR